MTTGLLILLGFCVAMMSYCVTIFTKTVTKLVDLAAHERRLLEDRLIALTDRDASLLVSAQEEKLPSTVTYMDEREEARLSPAVGFGSVEE